MTAHVRVNGVWVSGDPYVKVNGVWTKATAGYVRSSGVWTQAYTEASVTPPATPNLTLALANNNQWIDVTVSVPGAHDPYTSRVRVLARTDTYPSHYNGQGYVSGADNDFPHEPWSDFTYNIDTGHSATDQPITKQYPLNPTSTTQLPGGKYYYFTAWHEHTDGTWSAGKTAAIWMPSLPVQTTPPVVYEPDPTDPGSEDPITSPSPEPVEPSPTPTPSKTLVQETKTFTANWTRMYRGNGSLSHWGNADQHMWQGYSNATDGNRRSMIGFPEQTIRAWLDGKTITKVELYLYARNWYNASGIAVIGVHQQETPPSSWPSGGFNANLWRVRFQDWEGKWMDITDSNKGLWHGTRVGVILGKGQDASGTLSNDRRYTGLFADNMDANPPRIRFTVQYYR